MVNCIDCRYYNKEIKPEQLKIIVCTGNGSSKESCEKINNFRGKNV